MDDRRVDRRQVLRAALLAAAGLAVPAACGLPSGGHPIVDGPAPPTGPGTNDAVFKAPVPGDAFDAATLVDGFFGAVAGRLHTLPGDLDKANERAQAFLTTRAKGAWPQASQITVVRVVSRSGGVTGNTPNSTFIDVSLVPTGVLQGDGTVGPPTVTGEQTLHFTVIPNTDPNLKSRFLIDKIVSDSSNSVSGMMLASTWLDNNLYSPQLIYFWSTDNQRPGLVPDLRYVPKAGLSLEIQLTEIVDWVLAGPSPLIANAVQPNAYNGPTVLPNLVAPDKDGLLINLTNAPQGLSLEQVMAQMRWSLRQSYTGTVRLQINSQPQSVNGSSSDFGGRNLADQQYRGKDSSFCVAGGAVRQLDAPANEIPALDGPDANKGVVLAALSRDLKCAALVKSDRHLYIATAAGSDPPILKVATLTGQAPLTGQLNSPPGSAQGWTRPVFLPANDYQVLVGLDGRLYAVTSDGQARLLSLNNDLTVAAFSVAPDGHRIALVSGGHAFVGGLKTGSDGVSVVALRQIEAGLTDCTGIAWSRLDRVLVAGKADNAFPLAEVTIDGAIVSRWIQPFSASVTSVVALPPLPWLASGSGTAMTQGANGVASQVFPGGRNAPLVLPASGPPSPSASGGGTQAGTAIPTNPFYID